MATLIQSEVVYVPLRNCHRKLRPTKSNVYSSCLPGIFRTEKKLEVLAKRKIEIFIFENRLSSIIKIAFKVFK